MIENIRFDEKGLVPAIIQDADNHQVLMLAYMNQEALNKTVETGYTWFFSRSRNCLWKKGETSGHVQAVREISYDCDGDTLLVKVDQTGPACHEGTRSCFSRALSGESIGQQMADPDAMYGKAAMTVLHELYQVIVDRRVHPKEGSYTNYLFTSGQDKILKKVGEESAETIIASKNQAKPEILYEMADLWYHCLVLLAYHNITPTELLEELAGRRK